MPTRKFRLLLHALGALAASLGTQAATWTVGPGGDAATVAQALRLAADGDVIEVAPGRYEGDVAVITQRRLTIRGGEPRPVIAAAGRHAEGKAIWVVRDGEVTIENIEFRGARVPELNGAGIRFERGRLRVVRCAFFDNEMGLLTSNASDAELEVEASEFGQAPSHPGSLHHLLYVGRIAHATIRGSRFEQGHLGHLIKSRARETTITHSRIVDGPHGRASYEIDLPNGGLARVAGNTIGQSEASENAAMLSYGAEGSPWPASALTIEDNLFVNDRPGEAWFVRVWRDKLPPDAKVVVRGNRLAGSARLELGPGAVESENRPVTTRP